MCDGPRAQPLRLCLLFYIVIHFDHEFQILIFLIGQSRVPLFLQFLQGSINQSIETKEAFIDTLTEELLIGRRSCHQSQFQVATFLTGLTLSSSEELPEDQN